MGETILNHKKTIGQKKVNYILKRKKHNDDLIKIQSGQYINICSAQTVIQFVLGAAT